MSDEAKRLKFIQWSLTIIIYLALIGLIWAVNSNKLAFVLGDSLEAVTMTTYQKGCCDKSHEFVFVEVQNPMKKNETVIIVKRIGCKEGERLIVDSEKATCQRLLGTINHEMVTKHGLKPFVYDEVIPAGQYFILGDHPKSYDSRYLGLIKAKDIKGTGNEIF